MLWRFVRTAHSHARPRSLLLPPASSPWYSSFHGLPSTQKGSLPAQKTRSKSDVAEKTLLLQLCVRLVNPLKEQVCSWLNPCRVPGMTMGTPHSEPLQCLVPLTSVSSPSVPVASRVG